MSAGFLDLRAGLAELEPQLSAALHRVRESGRFVLGPEVEGFEREFAAFCQARHCVAVGSGLDALALTLRAWGIGPGDEVLVPAYTAVATWMAVRAAGAFPVGVDIDPVARTIDCELLEAAITSRTRAIIPVHLFGVPADMDAVSSVAARHGLPVLEDAAHAHGARHGGRRVGSLATAAAFSFYPTKNLGALGDGGAVTTDDAELADRLAMMRSSGWRTPGADSRTEGFSSRLDEIQAAVLRLKLGHLEAWNERRAGIAHRYLAGLAGVEAIGLPQVPNFAEASWHLFVVAVNDRDELRRRLDDAGIPTLVHYDPLPHLTTALRPAHGRPASFPVAEHLARGALSLPLYPQLPPHTVDRGVRGLRQLCGVAVRQTSTARS